MAQANRLRYPVEQVYFNKFADIAFRSRILENTFRSEFLLNILINCYGTEKSGK